MAYEVHRHACTHIHTRARTNTPLHIRTALADYKNVNDDITVNRSREGEINSSEYDPLQQAATNTSFKHTCTQTNAQTLWHAHTAIKKYPR